MVKHVVFAVPGSLDTPTGGYVYDRRIIAELRELGWDVDVLNIGEGFPWPNDATRSAARSALLDAAGGPAHRAGRPGTGRLARCDGRARVQEPAACAGASPPCPGMGTVFRPGRRATAAASRPPSPPRGKSLSLALPRQNLSLPTMPYRSDASRSQGPAAILRRAPGEARVTIPSSAVRRLRRAPQRI